MVKHQLQMKRKILELESNHNDKSHLCVIMVSLLVCASFQTKKKESESKSKLRGCMYTHTPNMPVHKLGKY